MRVESIEFIESVKKSRKGFILPPGKLRPRQSIVAKQPATKRLQGFEFAPILGRQGVANKARKIFMSAFR